MRVKCTFEITHRAGFVQNQNYFKIECHSKDFGNLGNRKITTSTRLKEEKHDSVAYVGGSDVFSIL